MGASSVAAAVFKALATAALLCAGCTSINADARTFEGTRWQVSAINGRPTPATGNYVLRFGDGRIGGQVGCNHLGGDYRAAGDVLTTTALVMTEMACSEPAASFESSAIAVLQQPMRMGWISGQRLTLSNAAGSLALERLP